LYLFDTAFREGASMEFLHSAGGYAKLTLAMGLVPLIMAIIYVINPTERNLALMRPLSLAALFSSLSGPTLGFLIILRDIGQRGIADAGYGRLATGASESLVPTFFGFACLSVAWLLVAVGMSRSRAEV
jgi:hypothetical protein